MSEPLEDDQAAEVSPIQAIEQALGELDPAALVAGFACVVEWIEPDGSPAMSVIHTRMAPWHLHGMFAYAKSMHMGSYDDSEDYEDEIED